MQLIISHSLLVPPIKSLNSMVYPAGLFPVFFLLCSGSLWFCSFFIKCSSSTCRFCLSAFGSISPLLTMTDIAQICKLPRFTPYSYIALYAFFPLFTIIAVYFYYTTIWPVHCVVVYSLSCVSCSLSLQALVCLLALLALVLGPVLNCCKAQGQIWM